MITRRSYLWNKVAELAGKLDSDGVEGISSGKHIGRQDYLGLCKMLGRLQEMDIFRSIIENPDFDFGALAVYAKGCALFEEEYEEREAWVKKGATRRLAP